MAVIDMILPPYVRVCWLIIDLVFCVLCSLLLADAGRHPGQPLFG
jgi:hypothetical protein